MLTRKYPLRSKNEQYYDVQQGGSKKDGSVPFGGFPPILLCSRDDATNTPENKNREYSTHKTAVSIKDIMQKRRDIVPFISN